MESKPENTGNIKIKKLSTSTMTTRYLSWIQDTIKQNNVRNRSLEWRAARLSSRNGTKEARPCFRCGQGLGCLEA